MKRARLDAALVERGLVETRSKAQALIMARRVTVNDQYVDSRERRSPATMLCASWSWSIRGSAAAA